MDDVIATKPVALVTHVVTTKNNRFLYTMTHEVQSLASSRELGRSMTKTLDRASDYGLIATDVVVQSSFTCVSG